MIITPQIKLDSVFLGSGAVNELGVRPILFKNIEKKEVKLFLGQFLDYFYSVHPSLKYVNISSGLKLKNICNFKIQEININGHTQKFETISENTIGKLSIEFTPKGILTPQFILDSLRQVCTKIGVSQFGSKLKFGTFSII